MDGRTDGWSYGPGGICMSIIFILFIPAVFSRKPFIYMANRGQPFIYHDYHRQGTSLTHRPLSLPALRAVIESHRRTSFQGGEVFGREIFGEETKRGGVKRRGQTESLVSHDILRQS